MRLLIIEDDVRVADFLKRGLTAEGWFCVTARDGEEGLELARDGDFDMILLDLMLPGIHGHDVCQQLRVEGFNTPLIILTAMDSQEDVIKGLRMGADDYLTKPFAFDELLARMETVRRRAAGAAAQSRTLRAGPLAFDLDALQVTLAGEPLRLTAKELAMLELFMSQPGKLFSRERILNNIWGLHMDPMTNVVDVYIGKLRKKLASANAEGMIETVRGMGYRFTPPSEH
ncbi:MAG: response regulator transcription factor [Pseudomonadota bacterium]